VPPSTIRTLVAVAGTVVLGACSVSVGTDKLDTAKLQREISTGIEQQTSASVSSVSCPDNVEGRKGTTFDCTATLADGTTLTAQVDVTDDEGNVHWQLVD